METLLFVLKWVVIIAMGFIGLSLFVWFCSTSIGRFVLAGCLLYGIYTGITVYIIPAILSVVPYVKIYGITWSSILMLLSAGIAVVVGLGFALTNYVKAIRTCIDFKQWEWNKGNNAEPAKRSYFFGPGYAQLSATIKKAVELNRASISKVFHHFDTVKEKHGCLIAIFVIPVLLCDLVYKIVAIFSIFIIGTVLCILLGLLHGTVTAVFMVLIYIVFSIVWVIDRLYLLIHKIRSDCPECHSRVLIPMFKCPQCNAEHRELVPGPYGIFYHKCNCGYKLPSTFFTGRSRLKSYCPVCTGFTKLVASDARPIVFQLVGGTKSGKTVFLSAFFHEYLSKLRKNTSFDITIAEEYQPYFAELEEWYGGIDCPSTTQLNSQMYPLLISSSTLGTKRQFSIYDIAGEMFNGRAAESEIQQQQLTYCDGILFLFDPFSSGDLRSERINSGKDISVFSDMPIEDVVNNFINYLISIGKKKANIRCDVPVAVLIAKSDISEIKREIGPEKIYSIIRKNPDLYPSYEKARDEICRNFLRKISLSFVVDNLETEFSNIHYFPVSAMGHEPDGTVYRPWGVTEAVEWMLPLADKKFAELINPAIEVKG